MFSLLLLLGVVSCAWGYAGPVASTKFDSYLPNACNSNWHEVKDVDACIGCFCSFSKMRQSPEAYDTLVRCKDSYLVQEPYETCRDIVSNATDGSANTSATYCSFEKCMATASNDELVRGCLTEADPNQQLTLESFTNAVTCILAKHRCRPDPNYQGNTQRNNALFTNKDGRLDITNNVYFDQITSPCNTGPDGQYIYDPNPIQQADWPSAQCSSMYPDSTTPPPSTTTFIST